MVGRGKRKMCFDICPMESKVGWVSDLCNGSGGRAPLPSVKPRRLAAFVSGMPDVKEEKCKCPPWWFGHADLFDVPLR